MMRVYLNTSEQPWGLLFHADRISIGYPSVPSSGGESHGPIDRKICQ